MSVIYIEKLNEFGILRVVQKNIKKANSYIICGVALMVADVQYRLLADLVLFTHAAFVVFVVLGLVLVYVGGVCKWRWVRNPWFRAAHLLAIGIVVAQAWLGAICPLTTFEMALRSKGGDTVYFGSFIAHWVELLLYWEAPPWVFTLIYTAFGLLVAASWFVVRPRSFIKNR